MDKVSIAGLISDPIGYQGEHALGVHDIDGLFASKPSSKPVHQLGVALRNVVLAIKELAELSFMQWLFMMVKKINRHQYLGSIVEVEGGAERRYKIVGEDEADLKQNKISVMSPIARALVGKSEGDTVVVKAPSGSVEYEIDKVEHL